MPSAAKFRNITAECFASTIPFRQQAGKADELPAPESKVQAWSSGSRNVIDSLFRGIASEDSVSSATVMPLKTITELRNLVSKCNQSEIHESTNCSDDKYTTFTLFKKSPVRFVNPSDDALDAIEGNATIPSVLVALDNGGTTPSSSRPSKSIGGGEDGLSFF